MLARLEQLSKEAAELAAAPLWPLSDHDVTGMLHAAHHLAQVATVLQARLVRQACSRGIPAAQGHRSAKGWLRSVLLVDPQPARELVAHADVLQRPVIGQAVLDGRADLRQAAVIAETLDALPDDLALTDGAADTFAIVEQAEVVLLGMAGEFPAYQLRRVGERILDHVAPEIADQAAAAALARQEARVHPRRGFTMSLPVNGMVRLSGALGLEDAAVVQAALHPLCEPGPEDKRTPAQQRADALIEISRLALRSTELPVDGGEPPQLSVSVAYDPLARAWGVGTTDTGVRVSPETVRRLACDARILPIILGGQGQILNAGRRRRLATGALRRALHVRDRGCGFPGCDRPPRWADAHHVWHWADGGPTNLDNLVLLCVRHHKVLHDPRAGWRIRFGPDRRPDFIPPPDVDPYQKPCRNQYHQRQ
ncbi:HNH endonuclease signature motif containing protein [Winogradskya humida]|nr:HNH endonuclease signature motif containing protein [Actinoplanes humidus]